ncbi:Werner Syndrome-like exonuclease [Panicum virgatum]|nr:Werner Syndrome-like exonuclease [Panicum virgatum]
MKGTYDTDVVMDDGTVIRTTVTSSGDAVEAFLREVVGSRHGQQLLVGIDTEWRVVAPEGGRGRPRNRMAVLQLCVGRRGLVFQIFHADRVPVALGDFLACPGHRFLGVAVDGDVRRLAEDCGLVVANAVELRRVAAEALGRPELRDAGLKALTREVTGAHIDKPKRLTMSKWDERRLTAEQVRYACIDAFVCYEIGRLLLTGECAEGAAANGGATMIPPPPIVASSAVPVA